MMRFTKKTEDRKALVKRLGELTGVKPHYNGVPSCTYTIGEYTVEKNGSITVEEEKVDMEIVNTLAAEELIETPKMETADASDAGTGDDSETCLNGTFPTKLSITLSLDGHTGTSIRNLMNLIFSRAGLLNKAIGSHFKASEDLVKALAKQESTATREKALKTITSIENGLEGIDFADDKVCFTGFPMATSPEEFKAFMDLAAFMNKSAIEQKRIMAKEVDDTNEKYACRVWLLRLGMTGDEFKTTRRIILQNLSGHAAFKTQDQVEAAKEKAKAKRAAEKEAATAEGGTSDDELSE